MNAPTPSPAKLIESLTAPKVRINGVKKNFDLRGRTVEALSSINLDIRRGEFFCIVGPSGCGKTTLLRILAGLEFASEGDIDFTSDGAIGITGKPRRANSVVFQEQSIFPWMSVRRNVAFGLKAQGVPRARRYEISDHYIEKVGLTAFRDAYPYQLSGGMKQRVSIARAFANDPEMLLMDEPFAALDEQTKIVLQGELLRIWEETQKTVVYVTHSIDEAIVLADRVLVMTARPGRIKEIIDINRVFGRPRRVEEVKSSPAYGQLFGRIWGALRDEVAAHERSERLRP